MWADRESSLSLRGRAYTYIPRTVQPLTCIMSGYRAGDFIYGLITVIQSQRIAPHSSIGRLAESKACQIAARWNPSLTRIPPHPATLRALLSLVAPLR